MFASNFVMQVDDGDGVVCLILLVSYTYDRHMLLFCRFFTNADFSISAAVFSLSLSPSVCSRPYPPTSFSLNVGGTTANFHMLGF